MAKDFDATITRQQLDDMIPDLLDTLRELVIYGGCRQNNAHERKSLAQTYARLSQKAIDKYPLLKLTHVGAKTIIKD